jgi:hypothetical protein
MNSLRRLGALCMALIITSCASVQPRVPEIQLPPERISLKGYSLVPLNEQGWQFVERDAHKIALVKHGENPDETVAIQTIPFELSASKTNEEFIHLIKEGQNRSTDPRRFKIVKNDVALYPKNGVLCARSHIVSEDSAAVKKSGTPGVMVFEITMLTCQHPKEKAIGITIGYSQRYYPGQRDPAFDEKAMRVLDSVEFTDL